MSSALIPIWQSLVWAIPYLATLVVGIFLAVVRWQRHPAVSALLLFALAGTLVSAIGYRIAAPLIIAGRGGAPLSSIALYLGLLGIVVALVRTVCWALTIAAILGWRTAPGDQGPAPLQFSIRGLIVVTFAVALLLGLGRWLTGLLRETGPMLVQLVDDIPVVACLGIGIWICVVRWSRHPSVSLVATGALAIAAAVTLLPQLIMIATMSASIRSDAFFLLMNTTSMIAASVSWALAIAAALGWRSPATPFTISAAQRSPPFP
jgi:hypothetical protein